MSGWDTSSTPTWGPQDESEDTQAFTAAADGPRDFGQDFGTQDFAVQDFGRPVPSSPPAGFPEAPGGFPGDSSPSGPPPEFFGRDYGQQEIGPGGFPQRKPGRSMQQNLPRREVRGRHSTDQTGSYGQSGAYGQAGAHDQTGAYDQDRGHGKDWSGGPSLGAAGGGWSAADQADDGGWGQSAGRSAAPWEGRPRQDSGYPGPDGPEFGRQDLGRQDFDRQDLGREDFGRQEPRHPGFAGQDYVAQDYVAQDFAGQRGPGHQGRGPQDPQAFERRDRDVSARMDPALQDFFAPQSPRPNGGRSAPGRFDSGRPGPGLPGPGQRGGAPGYPDQGPGRPDEPRDTRYRPPESSGWAAARPSLQNNGAVPRPAPRAARREPPRKGLGLGGLLAIGAVVVIVIVVGVFLLKHKSSGSSSTAGTGSASTGSTAAAKAPKKTPAKGKSTPAATSGKGTGSTKAVAGFVLSTPATAGGYPEGQDPHFLATATATAGQVSAAVTKGGAGTAAGSPVSAAYELPVGGQVVTFVGYQGTFTPSKVATILATLGTDQSTYPAGPNGGILGCANTVATATTTSGAVCVWSTTSTLGVTEFFSSTGPEALTASQSRGATDTVAIRASVEAKKA
jgi:hypothetical protein